MVFDSQRNRIVLFGGVGAGLARLGDTWEWDGVRWVLIASSGPGGRSNHAMAYDSIRGRTVLFGGQDGSGARLQDTWEWDGTTWIPRLFVSVPPSRRDHAMTYDANRGRVVLFGGWSNTLAELGDTWEWDGSVWRNAPAAGPAARRNPALAFDAARNRVVLFGGIGVGNSYFGDTWEWDGATWTLSTVGGPSARFAHAMAYDAPRGRLVLFGGFVALSDTWERSSGLTASASPIGAGCGSPPLTISSQATRPVMGQVHVANVANTPSAAVAMAIGFSASSVNGFALPIALDPFGMTGCMMYHDAAYGVFSPCTAPVAGVSQHSLFIPNDPLFLGLHVYFQAWALDPSANTFGAVTSNALDLLLGNL